MAEVQSKKRRPNFNDEELHAMIAAVQQRKTILLAKFDNNVTAKTKNSAWEAVREVNLVSRVHHDFAEVKKKFSNFRGIVKIKAANEKKTLL